MINKTELEKINQEIKDKGFVDREHLMKFLTLISTNDAPTIIKEVKDWLQFLHDSPEFSAINFAPGDIDSVLGDLDSYGRVTADTIQQFKQSSNKVVAQT